MVRLERLMLSSLLGNDGFSRACLPYMRPDYFGEPEERVVYELTAAHFSKYNTAPTKESLAIDLDAKKGLPQRVFDAASEVITELDSGVESDQTEWLLDRAEEWAKDRALYNALLEFVKVTEDTDGKFNRGSIVATIQEALAVSFDQDLGHDYLEDAEDRWEMLHATGQRLPLGIEMFDKITKGGFLGKTLNVFMAGTNVGKTLIMCHFAEYHLRLGLNVLYITLEMAAEQISNRIDANCLDATTDELDAMSKEDFLRRVSKVKDKTHGKIIVQEYPTTSASADNFRHLLNELRMKKNFVPDVVYVDYINICASSRLKLGGQGVNSYGYVKAIAEEIRGLAVETGLPFITATQTNRTGFSSSDPGLEDVAESFGLPQTADFMVSLSVNEELESLDQYVVKQLKNRYGGKRGKNTVSRFVVGVDYDRMRIYDVEAVAQTVSQTVAPPVSKKQPPGKEKFGDFK